MRSPNSQTFRHGNSVEVVEAMGQVRDTVADTVTSLADLRLEHDFGDADCIDVAGHCREELGGVPRESLLLAQLADKVLAVVRKKTVVEKPFVARVLAAVTKAITFRGGTVTYPTLLGAMIATLETKDAERQGASNQSPVTVYVELRTTRCVRQIFAASRDCLMLVVPRVPRAVLVLQAPRLVSMHRILLERHSKNLSIQKSVMSSLSKVVPCLDRSSANSVRVLLGVLIPTMVHRRKRRLAFGHTHCRRCFEDGVHVRTQERDVPSGEEMGWKVVEEPLKEAVMASAVTDSKIRFRRQDALDAAVLSVRQFLSAVTTLMPLADGCASCSPSCLGFGRS